MFRPQTHKKLLIISLTINLLGFLVGGLYIYRTAYVIKGWFNRHIKGISIPYENIFYKPRVEIFKLLEANRTTKKAIVFAGDSLIENFEWAEYFTNLEDAVILNRGIRWDTIDGLMDRFEVTFLSGHKLQKVFIMVGVNDILQKEFRIEDFSNKYSVLLDKLATFLPPDKICIHSILPVRGENKLTTTIRKVNEYLRSYAHAKGFCYIDLYDKLADSTGQLDAKYSLPDGIHLMSEGYKVWHKAIEPHVLNSINSAM